jgi:hypothetical protein
MKKTNYVFICILIALASCDGGSSSSGSSSDQSAVSGQGGSMARFTIVGDYLYTVDDNSIKMFDIEDAEHPAYLPSKDQSLETGAETIFPLDTLLFIGSQTGMYIYDISRPGFPKELTYISHIRSCDPVVSDGKYAYVTLNSQNTVCGRNVNQLLVYALTDIENPTLLYTITNFSSPRGLGLLNDKLYICDNGLKVYDVSDPSKQRPEWTGDLSHISELRTVDAYDVIPLADRNIILLIGADGFYQLDASGETLKLMSSIKVKQN